MEKQKKSKRKWNKKRVLIGYSFILPNLAGFMLITLIPMVFSVVLSVLEWDSGSKIEWRGLSNYISLLSDATFKKAFVNTLYYAVVTVPTTLIVALVLAVFMNKGIKGLLLYRQIYFFPYVAATLSLCAVWNMIFYPSEAGLVNGVLAALGVKNLPRWSADPVWAMPTIIGFGVWKNVGYYMIVYLAALQGIPRELYEAAAVDGGSGFAVFKNVTIPMVTPTTFFILIMLVISAFNVFDPVYMLTSGGPGRSSYVLTYYLYEKAFVSFKFGYASSIGMVLFLIVLTITIIQFRMNKKVESYM